MSTGFDKRNDLEGGSPLYHILSKVFLKLTGSKQCNISISERIRLLLTVKRAALLLKGFV